MNREMPKELLERIAHKSGRGSGRTARALFQASERAVYVAVNTQQVSYVEGLARYLGREDIRVVSGSALRPDHFYGIDREIVFDHAFLDMRWNNNQAQAYEIAVARNKMRRR